MKNFQMLKFQNRTCLVLFEQQIGLSNNDEPKKAMCPFSSLKRIDRVKNYLIRISLASKKRMTIPILIFFASKNWSWYEQEAWLSDIKYWTL